MNPGSDYDVSALHALRGELERLNAAASRDGILGRRGAQPETDAPGRRAKDGSPRTGKAGAKRLLKMLGRIAGDDSPLVPGTDFTENGVVRLLAHMRKPRSQRRGILQRMHRFLSRPTGAGARASAGISVERLQVVSRQLLEIKARGWYQFQSIRAARRGGRASPSQTDASVTPRPTAPSSGPQGAAGEFR